MEVRMTPIVRCDSTYIRMITVDDELVSYYIFALENSNVLLIRLQDCLFILETVSTEVNVQDKRVVNYVQAHAHSC